MTAKKAVRGNLEVAQIAWFIRAAKMGYPNDMPTAYRWLAVALRSGTLTAEETEFIAGRLEAVADAAPADGNASPSRAKTAATAIVGALLLVRGARTTKHDAENLEFKRAVAMRDLVDAGMTEKAAADHLAMHEAENGGASEPRPFREAFAKWGQALAGEGVFDGGEDPRL